MNWVKAGINELNVLEKNLFIEGDFIKINLGGNEPLCIQLDSCDTHEKILSCVMHLTEKKSMDSSMVHRFIFLASEHNSIPIN